MTLKGLQIPSTVASCFYVDLGPFQFCFLISENIYYFSVFNTERQKSTSLRELVDLAKTGQSLPCMAAMG